MPRSLNVPGRTATEGGSSYLVPCIYCAVACAAVLLLMIEQTIWACGGTPPSIFCGKTYTFGVAGNLNVVTNQAGTLDLNTFHHLNLISFGGGGSCPSLPATLMMEASIDGGPLSGPGQTFGPFNLNEGITNVPITLNVQRLSTGAHPVTIVSNVSFTDGTIIEHSDEFEIFSVPAQGGDPTVPRLAFQLISPNVVQAHPGDGGGFTIAVFNLDAAESLDATITIRSNQIGTVPTVTAGPDTVADGVFSAADPGGGDDFPLAFDFDIPPGACVPHPTQPHLDTDQSITLPVNLAPGSSQQHTFETRSNILSTNGSANTYTIDMVGQFSDTTAAAAGTRSVFAVDTTQPPAFACPTDAGRATVPTPFTSVLGPAIQFLGDATAGATQPWATRFTLDNASLQLTVDGVPITSASNFSDVHQIDGPHARIAADLSFITPPPPPNAVFDVQFEIVIDPSPASPNAISTTLDSIGLVQPASLVDFAPFAVGHVSIADGGVVDPAVQHFKHQLSVVGVLDDGLFTPVRLNNYGVFLQQLGAGRYLVSSRWQDPTPGAIPFIGFDVFNDFRGIAIPDNAGQLDCNNNGVDDEVEILSGSAADANNDGILDECQAQIELRQLSLVGPNDIDVVPFTDIGELSVRTHQPPTNIFTGDQPYFVNAVIDGQWKVQNGLMHRVTREDEQQEYSYLFKWDTTPGVPVLTAMLAVSITTDPLAAPPANAPDAVNVPEHKTDPNGEHPDGDPPPTFYEPGPGEDYANAASETYRIKKRYNVPGISEQKNFCVPGGTARSLLWMNDLYCLGFPPECLDPQALMTTLGDAGHMNTSVVTGTIPSNQITGLNQFFADKGIASKLKIEHVNANSGGTPTPDMLCKALCEGKDAMFSVNWFKADGTRNGGHYMTAVGVAIGETTGSKHFAFRDDDFGGDKQGDGKADKGVSVVQFKPIAGGRYEVVGAGLGTNKLARVVTICPRPLTMIEAMGKYLDEAAQDFTDTASSGQLPTYLERQHTFEIICRALEISEFLRERLNNEFPGETALLDCIDSLQFSLFDIKINTHSYVDTPDSGFAAFLASLIDEGLFPKLNDLADRFDCNLNGIDDSYDLQVGTSHDINFNGIPDECDCPGDITNVTPGQVDVIDLLTLLGNWGACPAPCPGTPCPGDVNFDCVIDVVDLLILLGNWGACP